MSAEINTTNAAVELSEEELDVVAGGLDISFGNATQLLDASSANFKQENLFFAQQTFSGPFGSGSVSVLNLQKIETSTNRVTIVS